ncbi:MAG TPA: tetratricopeptide repeat protein [Candidatus Binatia bacterium]|jgi:tetratricopeptide (TPR) repeat protein|nr:tetratricopeptide repeat protein [Candidatus Binatia bacterium]
MGRALISQLLPTLQKLKWEGKPEPTPAGALVFRTAVDQVDGYRGDPRVLGVALRTIRTGESLPYNYAGVAYILLAAAGPETHGLSMSADNEAYDETGLEAALKWLEKAQELAPDEIEINAIEALVYIHGQRYDDARLVLDYLQGQAPDDFFLLRAEMTYWYRVGDYQQALEWNERALQQAETVPQRLRLKSVAAAIHQQAGDTEQALRAYTEALHFDDNNAWLCHEISLLHYELEAYEEAARYNERALKSQPDFPEAQQLKEQLAEQQRSSGLLGRLFG